MSEIDTLRRFVFERYPFRGQLVHLGPAWQAMMEHHDYPANVRDTLGEAVAAGNGPHALMDHGDVVPIGEVLAYGRCAHRIVARHVAERVVGEHDTPPECGVRGVAFEHRDLVARIAKLHRDREVQTSRAAPEAQHLHRRPV